MAWTSSATALNVAGAFITMLDSLLVTPHSEWTAYDTFGTNQKVYRCLDASNDPLIDYYVYVQDNQTGYARIEIWQGWDTSTHAGVGYSITYGGGASYYPYVGKAASGYYFSSLPHRFIYVDKFEWAANYVGSLKTPPGCRPAPWQMIVLITTSTGYASGYNALGRCVGTGTSAIWRGLIGTKGAPKVVVQAYNGVNADQKFQTIAGSAFVIPAIVADDSANNQMVMGLLENVSPHYNYVPWDNDDYLTIGGDTWRYIEGTSSTRYSCFIKEE